MLQRMLTPFFFGFIIKCSQSHVILMDGRSFLYAIYVLKLLYI